MHNSTISMDWLTPKRNRRRPCCINAAEAARCNHQNKKITIMPFFCHPSTIFFFTKFSSWLFIQLQNYVFSKLNNSSFYSGMYNYSDDIQWYKFISFTFLWSPDLQYSTVKSISVRQELIASNSEIWDSAVPTLGDTQLHSLSLITVVHFSPSTVTLYPSSMRHLLCLFPPSIFYDSTQCWFILSCLFFLQALCACIFFCNRRQM